MRFKDIWQQVASTILGLDLWGIAGLIFGLLAVYFLIKRSIWTWPFGILCVLVSFVVFWHARLYGDFLLHIFFLIFNIYGWLYWVRGRTQTNSAIQVSHSSVRAIALLLAITLAGIWGFARLLIAIPDIFDGIEPPALPYWDSTTSMLSITGMWLTARKKIDNWYYWFVVDILSTGIYLYKELYFYALLYLIYVGMAVAGYLSWRKTMVFKI